MTVLSSYNPDPTTITLDTPVQKALQLLIQSGTMDAVVVDEENYPVGTFSIREMIDYLVPILPENEKEQPLLECITRNSKFLETELQKVKDIQVEDIMDIDCIKVSQNDHLEEVIAKMLCYKKFIVIVIDPTSKKLAGAITQKEMQTFMNKALKVRK
jgi:CBS domain-containing protein